MTVNEMESMSNEEIVKFQKLHSKFVEGQTLEEYTTAIRDLLYTWENVHESRKSYTIEIANERIKNNKVQIKSFYEEKEPAASAAIDVDFCCG